MPQRLSDILSTAMGVRPVNRVPAAAPAPPPVATPAVDQLAMSRASGPLQKLLAGTEPTPAEWLVLGAQIAAMDVRALATVANRLAAAGFVPSSVANGRYATFQSPNLTVTVEPTTGRIRRTAGGNAELIERGVVTTRYTYLDGLITVRRGKRTEEVWTQAGQGARNGVPIVAPPAPWPAGETPRVPPAEAPRNRFRQPIYKPGDDPAAFLAKVDEAMIRAGGEVLVPANAAIPDADWHNCFSHALSGGEGDLADPFDRTSAPRWLLQPHYQLNGGRFDQVAPNQRVHPGDLIVYKVPGTEAITHVAIVKAVDAGGNPSRIESKFGAWGVYLHNPHDVLAPYGEPAGFYRARPQ